MAVILGKRKRLAEKKPEPSRPKKKVQESDESGDDDEARALFQRAFEKKFQPLEKSATPLEEESGKDLEEPSDSESDEDGSDWSGLSGGEDVVEVVEHAKPALTDEEDLRLSKKKYMVCSPSTIKTNETNISESSKPPTLEDDTKVSRKLLKTDATEEEGTETSNLKNDLALQRLLKESHLLDPSSFSASSGPEGKDRLKALDMRLQDLGAKTSTLQQDKMPFAHRKGIVDKSASRETKRRKEAAENGVILEKQKGKSKPQTKRDRGIGGPGIGKFRGGTLQLSSRDLRDIQGSRSGSSGRRGRGGKR